MLIAKEKNTGNAWQLQHPKAYTGMMKVYFPAAKSSLSFISENKDVKLSLKSAGSKISEVVYGDAANRLMDEVQTRQRNREVILPALVQMKEYYPPSSAFGQAMATEISNLNTTLPVDAAVNPFVAFYSSNYSKFVNESAKPSQEALLKFVSSAGPMLESSTLLRPVLEVYLKNAGSDFDGAVSRLLTAVNAESPRGQVVLSELIDLFDAYGMSDRKEKYLALAQNMKCTIFDRLALTMTANKNTEIGATFPDYTFANAKNTTAKKLSDVQAVKKVVIFWSSTCSHCEAELPQLLPFYKDLKAKNIEVIGFSLDNDRAAYENRIKDFPWVNDSELKGWYSSYGDTYNVKATPTYFVLDGKNRILAKPDHIGDLMKYLQLQ